MWPKIQVFTPNKGTQKSMPVRLKWSLYLTPCHMYPICSESDNCTTAGSETDVNEMEESASGKWTNTNTTNRTFVPNDILLKLVIHKISSLFSRIKIAICESVIGNL